MDVLEGSSERLLNRKAYNTAIGETVDNLTRALLYVQRGDIPSAIPYYETAKLLAEKAVKLAVSSAEQLSSTFTVERIKDIIMRLKQIK